MKEVVMPSALVRDSVLVIAVLCHMIVFVTTGRCH